MLRQHTAGRPMRIQTRAAVCATSAAVRRLVIERGHLGVTNELVRHEAGTNSNRCGTVLAKLTRAGEIYGAQVAGLPKHWFASAELAQRWLSTTPPKPKPEPTPRKRLLTRTSHQPGAPVRLARRLDTRDAPVITPPGVQVQRVKAPTHDARYQCGPDERPAGAGFAAAGIGRDITTGQAWGQRA